jgi:hypothetical protein
MSMTVYHRIERELERREYAHEHPRNWADLGRVIGASAQRMHGWKVRGIPKNIELLQSIADALGWTLPRLLGEEAEPVRAPPPPPPAPPLLPVTDSEWGGLQPLIKNLLDLPAEERAAEEAYIAERAERARALTRARAAAVTPGVEGQPRKLRK